MRVFLKSRSGRADFSEVLENLFQSAGQVLGSTAKASASRGLQDAASRLQQVDASEQERETATLVASLEAYLEHRRKDSLPPALRPADPQAIAEELRISAKMSLKDLRRLRRAFAVANHPDRAGAAVRENANRRMTIANMLIDREIERRGVSRPRWYGWRTSEN